MAKKLKLSPWHDISINPVHVGVYEGFDDDLNKSYFSFWCGEEFHGWWYEIEGAIVHASDHYHRYVGCGITKWRGVLK